MQGSKYSHFSAIDFLKDEGFLTWQMFGEDSDGAYRQTVVADSPAIEPALREAVALYKRYVKLNDYRLPPYEIMERLVLLQGQIRAEKARRRRRRVALWVSGAAAAVAGLIVSATLLLPPAPDDNPPAAEAPVAHEASFPESSEVTLIVDRSAMVLSNNAQVSYMASGAIAVRTEDAGVAGALIREPIVETKQNKLIVPKGRRSSIILADNTHVWLNSGTTLIFPASFEQRREIYVDGEIYIEVEKDPARPFVVKSSALTIEVLGTAFNVSAYSSDIEQAVVLVEGSVAVAAGRQKMRLLPNQRFSTGGAGGNQVDNVDVTDYTCWRHGWIQTNTTSLEELATRLSRYYDREIVCDARVAHLKCFGKLVLFDDPDKVLHTISKNMNIEYRYKNTKTIILYPKK
ncbi:MAG: FecR domain-containing protein [Prevotellaceae bacterium]|nr:FecR domain-containing protein [Prevotellaceae bacterium]